MNGVTLMPWGEGDLSVLRRCNVPEMMLYLGGPETEVKLRSRHEKYLRLDASGDAHMFTVHVSDVKAAVGSVGYWRAHHNAQDIYEAGWSIQTAHQRRGIAAEALAMCLLNAATHCEHDFLFAFPRVDNTASNALCRRVGMVHTAEEDSEYPPGNPIRVNAWSIELTTLR